MSDENINAGGLDYAGWLMIAVTLIFLILVLLYFFGIMNPAFRFW